jgi:amino acid permease
MNKLIRVFEVGFWAFLITFAYADIILNSATLRAISAIGGTICVSVCILLCYMQNRKIKKYIKNKKVI